jgi:hypothetical protein
VSYFDEDLWCVLLNCDVCAVYILDSCYCGSLKVLCACWSFEVSCTNCDLYLVSVFSFAKMFEQCFSKDYCSYFRSSYYFEVV